MQHGFGKMLNITYHENDMDEKKIKVNVISINSNHLILSYMYCCPRFQHSNQQSIGDKRFQRGKFTIFRCQRCRQRRQHYNGVV